MSNVTLTIGGRNFTLACADGEEAHVLRLGGLVDEKVRQSGMQGHSESRMLLFAAVMLADEVDELSRRETQSAVDVEGLGQSLDMVARRIENLAETLQAGLESTSHSA